jgi:Kdo2-lipid IVA lauroyltransferase/acyltransferase
MTSLLYYLLFAFTWLISLIPFWFLYGLSDVLYIIAYYLVRYRKETVFGNLRRSFPEKSEREIEQLAKAFYRHFCDFLLELIKCIRISLHDLDRRFKYINLEVLTDLEKEDRDFALVSAHYNNWEWLINLPYKLTNDFLVIYRPLKNKAVDRLSSYMRGRHKPVLIAMESIFRHGLKYRSEGRHFSIWFIADQRPLRTSRFWTTFLNQETPFFEGVEKISTRLGLAIVFMDIQKVSRGYYEVTFKKLFDDASLTQENEVTLACVNEMEEEIRRRPEFWLWSHKRFKYTKPENIKLISR